MSRADDFIRLANRTDATLDDLLRDVPKNREWIAVLAFYKALHLVDAHMAYHNASRGGHVYRSSYIQSLPSSLHVYKQYASLHTTSNIARYMSCTPSSGHSGPFDKVCPDSAIANLINSRLAKFENDFIGRLPLALARAVIRRATFSPPPSSSAPPPPSPHSPQSPSPQSAETLPPGPADARPQ